MNLMGYARQINANYSPIIPFLSCLHVIHMLFLLTRLFYFFTLQQPAQIPSPPGNLSELALSSPDPDVPLLLPLSTFAVFTPLGTFQLSTGV